MAEKNNLKSIGVSKKPGSKQHATNSRNERTQEKDIFSRENEFKRLNEELEAKTAALVKEAESILKEQETHLAKPSSLLENINTDDFLIETEEQSEENLYRSDTRNKDSEFLPSSRPVSSRPSSNNKPNQLKNNASKAKHDAKLRGKSKKAMTAVDDVAVIDDVGLLAQMKDFSLEKTVAGIENRMDMGELAVDESDDILPSAAAEMGTEAQIRFLKAKLRVMQEELDRLSHECNKKDEESALLINRLKESEDERNRLQRTSTAQQSQLDKYKKLAEDYKVKTESVESQLVAVKKELESVKRVQKQQTQTSSATEVRLNRALEEIDKYKQQLQKSKVETKDLSEQERRKFDELVASNKRLEKQKSELINGFKKQLKLIDILKKQKMHIEAAKVLSFTEEEFVKALEWGS